MTDIRKELEMIESEYVEPTPDRIVDQKILQHIARYVVSRLNGKKVLELGVGDQVWTPMLTAQADHVTSLDASQGLLDAMDKKLAGLGRKNWTPVCTLFEEYEPQERYDDVLATYVLEHVDDPALILDLARRKWVKPGGRISVVVPHALSLHRRLAVEMGIAAHPGQLGETDRRMGHKHCFVWTDMEKLLVNAGFRIVESRGLFCKVLPNSMLTACNDAQLEGLFKLGLSLPIEYSTAIYFQAVAQ